MSGILNVYPLCEFVEPRALAGGVAVVIDVLRASTTIVYALEAGAREVIPVVEIDEAWELSEQFPPGQVVLGGERGGLPIVGFDLGNSPGDYTAERVERKTVLFTTSNGTRAMNHARSAERMLVAAFVNAAAIVGELVDQERIHLICAGTAGRISHDDVLLAGMLVERIQQHGGLPYKQNAQAVAAQKMWLGAFALPQALGAEPLEPERLANELAQSLAGRKLMHLGLEADVLAAAQIDLFRGVPEFDPEKSRIRLV